MLAGGHSLLPMMKLRLATPEYLIDIDDLAGELGYIRETEDEILIGAMTRHRELLESELLARRAAIFTDAERVIADPVVRNRGTIGGALCQADPSEDLSAVCAAVGRRDGDPGPGRRAPARRWTSFTGGPTGPRWPTTRCSSRSGCRSSAGAGSAYEKVDRRVGDWAVAAVGAALTVQDGEITAAGIGLAAVGGEITCAEARGAAGRRPADRRAPASRRPAPRRRARGR